MKLTKAKKKMKKKKKRKNKVHVKERTDDEEKNPQESASSESESSTLTTVRNESNAVPTTENVAIAIPQPQLPQNSRPLHPTFINHVMYLMVNNWQAQSIAGRIYAFILPFICMLMCFAFTLLFVSHPKDNNSFNTSSRLRSNHRPAGLSSYTSTTPLHVCPDSNFTRTFAQEMRTVWDIGRSSEGKPLEFIFYSTKEALIKKLNHHAENELAIQLPNDWDGARPFDYKIIPSPRLDPPHDYLSSGLLAVQILVDLTVHQWNGLSERGANLPHNGFNIRIKQMMGRRFYYYGEGAGNLYYGVAIITSMVPFLELLYKLLVRVVHEKTGVKNVLKMMGLSETAYWLSKLLYYGIFVVYYAIVVTVCLKLILFLKTNTFMFFVLLLLFGISCLALAYLLTAFFPSPKYTFIAYIVMYGTLGFVFVSTTENFRLFLVTIQRKYFVFNTIAVLASIHATVLVDIFLDQGEPNVSFYWSDVRPHNLPDQFFTTTFGNYRIPPDPDLMGDRVFFGIIFLLIDIIVYFLFGFYLNNVIPDQFGIRQSPAFLCSPSYWSRSQTAKTNAIATSSTTINADNFEPVPPGMFGAPAICIRNLRKNYSFCACGNGKRGPDALRGISLDIYAGQVTAILGKNGAGKSTLFHILIGLIPPTAGTTNIFGYNSSNPSDLVKIRRLVGVCLQHDVHFDFLTVMQHLQFFGKLRGFQGKALDQEVSKLIQDLKLEMVKNNPANKLSGGQKRRLSVGLAFIGNPPIIFLDEPSAGLDPVARRDLWSLLQSRREGKVILLTTHFMDEADILADRKAIMNDGIVECMGSSLFLKNRLGAGYQLTIELTSASVDTTAIDQIIAKFSPNASRSRKQIAHELKYSFPFSEASKFPSMFAQLELEMGKSINNLGIATTSLEDVFLKVTSGKVEEVNAVQKSHVEEQVDLLGNLGLLQISFVASLWAMMVLRLRRLFRSPCYFILLYIVPLLVTALALAQNLFLGAQRVYQHQPYHSRMSLRISDHKGIYNDSKVAVHDNGDNAVAIVEFLQNQGISVKRYTGGLQAWRQLSDLNLFMAALSIEMSRAAGSLTGDLWLNEGMSHAAPILLDLLFKFYAQNVEGKRSGGRVQVNTEYESMSRQQSDYRRLSTEFDIAATIFIPAVLGLTYSGPLVELAYDNEKQLRNHLRVSGLSPLIYYLSFFIIYFGLTFALYPLLVAVTVIFYVRPLTTPYALLILFGLTTLHIAEAMLLVFLLSLLVHKSSLVLVLYFPVYLLLVIVPAVIVLFPIGITSPEVSFYTLSALSTFHIPFGLYRGVQDTWDQNGKEPLAFSSYKIYQVTGALIIMVCHIVVYLGLLILINMGGVRKLFSSLCRVRAPPLKSQQLDEDVIDESQRIAEIFPTVGKNSDCVLIAKELRKSYGKTQILHGLSLLVEKGQVLGLLGHNGAGKTTTMRIITAEEAADSGQVKLGGYRIPEESNVAFRELGFCPQHDALWENIRVSEHLKLYSVIHGVPGSQRRLLAFRILDGLSIQEHGGKYSQNLSGGTKRKLSYAMAMASAPQIVLMDEPSTGMDPQSKRFLWNTVLGTFKENRGAILTTHAMEEADVLSTKIAIMAKGALLCVGSPQHLKSKYGRSYTLEIKLESFMAASTDAEGVESPVASQFDIVYQSFPNCNLVEQFGNRAVFSIPIESSKPLSETFALLERLKASHGIQEYAYTQTTLEQVYLTIDQAAQNNVVQ